MNDIIPRKIKTGGDPRTLPDYTALRDELSKLTHPARPDVNWQHVEKLCLSLFEQNGVELQTLAGTRWLGRSWPDYSGSMKVWRYWRR